MKKIDFSQYPVYLDIPNLSDVLHYDVKHKIARLDDTSASMD